MAAYAVIFILLAIAFFGVVYISTNIAINAFITEMNVWIAAGDLSAQFETYWGFVLGAWIILPLLFLFALAIWAYVHAIERRQDGI